MAKRKIKKGIKLKNDEPFDNYELHKMGYWIESGEEIAEPVDYAFGDEPQAYDRIVYEVFGHIPGIGVETIAVFSTPEPAQELLYRITGDTDWLKHIDDCLS